MSSSSSSSSSDQERETIAFLLTDYFKTHALQPLRLSADDGTMNVNLSYNVEPLSYMATLSNLAHFSTVRSWLDMLVTHWKEKEKKKEEEAKQQLEKSKTMIQVEEVQSQIEEVQSTHTTTDTSSSQPSSSLQQLALEASQVQVEEEEKKQSRITLSVNVALRPFQSGLEEPSSSPTGVAMSEENIFFDTFFVT